jgi:hypothetical protein
LIACLWLPAALLLAGPVAAATPWPEFRGPTGDGVTREQNLPVTWSESEGIAWKTPLAGKAWSSPVIWDGPVWLTTATADGTRLSVVAVDPTQGKVVRDITVFEITTPQFCHAFNSYASSTPVIVIVRVVELSLPAVSRAV